MGFNFSKKVHLHRKKFKQYMKRQKGIETKSQIRIQHSGYFNVKILFLPTILLRLKCKHL